MADLDCVRAKRRGCTIRFRHPVPAQKGRGDYAAMIDPSVQIVMCCLRSEEVLRESCRHASVPVHSYGQLFQKRLSSVALASILLLEVAIGNAAEPREFMSSGERGCHSVPPRLSDVGLSTNASDAIRKSDPLPAFMLADGVT